MSARQPAQKTEAAAGAVMPDASWVEALTERSSQIVWSATAEGVVDYLNPRWSAFTGTDPVAATEDRAWAAFVHPDDRGGALARWRRSVATGEPYVVEYRLKRHDGAWRWHLGRAWPQRDAHGAVVRWFGVAMDVDDIAQARDAAATPGLERLIAERTADLAAANQRAAIEAAGRRTEQAARRDVDALYAAYIDNTPDGVFVVSVSPEDGVRAETLNRVLERSLGVRRDAVQGRSLSEFMPVGLAERLTAKITECVTAAAPVRYEETVEIEGDVRVLEVTLAPVAGSRMDVARVVGSARDLTERREAEQQLRQAQKMEAVGQLTGGVAHDFNNLLQVVKGNLDLLAHELAGIATPTMERRLRDAMAGAARGGRLTRQLLAFSRRQPLAPKPTDVGALVSAMSDLLDRTLGETIAVDIQRDAENWTAQVDPAQLENAVLNLAINARDAMPEGGGLTIAVRNQPGVAGADDAIEISVADTGSGMTPAVLSRVFEPFFSTKPEGRGTGLGLPQVQGFIEQSNGRITIESAPERGTVVRLRLPRSAEAAVSDEDAVPPLGQTRGKGERILVVEDDDAVRTAVTDLLATLGYEVQSAGDTQVASTLLERETFALLLSDVVMPGSPTPPELARRARLAQPSLKVLFMSGYAEDAIVHHGRVDPDVHLIEKPYRSEQLAVKLRQLLEPKPSVQAAHRTRPVRVLLVEDEPLISMGVADLLSSFGYEVAEAGNGARAKAAIEAAMAADAGAASAVDIVITDLGLPDIDGEALAEWIRAKRPGVPIVFSTGRHDFMPPPLLEASGPVFVMTKPFDSETLRRTLESCAPRDA